MDLQPSTPVDIDIILQLEKMAWDLALSFWRRTSEKNRKNILVFGFFIFLIFFIILLNFTHVYTHAQDSIDLKFYFRSEKSVKMRQYDKWK